MKSELIAKLEELLQKDIAEITHEVRTLQKEFQKVWTAEFEKAKQDFINEGGKSKEFEYARQPEDVTFEELIQQFNKRKKDHDASLAAEQARNLIIRQEIIAKIKDLSQLSENVGAAVRKLQELQTQWKEAGPVSTHKYKDVQADYSRAVEDIYYNLKIYRDLQEHDLKKNLELKTALIEKLKTVTLLENVKEAERLIKVYRNEWDEIGPVPNSKWEALKQEYKAALDDTYAKIKTYYNSVEEQKENNLKAKQEIVEKARALTQNLDHAKAPQWNEITNQVLTLQAEWKLVGRAAEKDNDKVWADFRTVCDNFFDRKKEFFSVLNEKFAENRKIKSALISKAEALQGSTDWQKTGAELIRLQEEWKKHPSGGDKEEPRLFQRFRKACNAFFDAKKAYYENVDASYRQNLEVKEGILARLNEFVPGNDHQANHQSLKAFIDEWNAAGLVPMKEKKRVNDAFYNRMDTLYDQMHLDKQEKAIMQFKTKIDRMLASENPAEQLRRESDYLKKAADEINGRLRTYENNLGFFKTSKGSNQFMKEVEEKIDAEKNKMADLNARRKLVNEELARLRDSKQKAEA